MPASYETHRKQLELILRAWGMAEATADSTAEIMSWADLHGIDTHGISMVPGYDQRRRDGKIDMRAEPTVAQGDAGLGAGRRRRRARPRQCAARHGACHRQGQDRRHRRRGRAQLGAFRRLRLLRADGGRGRPDRHGRDVGERHPGGADLRRAGASSAPIPIAFAAPGKPGEPFLLDMATTTVAAGKIRNKANEKLPTPPGWLVTTEGKPSTDPLEVEQGRVPDPARRHAGGQQPQGLRPVGDGEHPVVGAVGRHHDHRPAAHQEARQAWTSAISCWRSIPACSATPTTSAPTSRPSATRCAPPSPSTRRSRSWWPAIPSAAPPLSGARPAFPSARVFWPRSATSRSLPARSGSWTG